METHRTQGSPTAAHFSQTVRATFLVSVCSVAIIAVGSGKPIEAAQQSDATELIETTGFDSQTFVITAPSVTAAITPLTATVPLNGTTQFIAYAVGNINNAITVQVNGVAGGSTSTGHHRPHCGPASRHLPLYGSRHHAHERQYRHHYRHLPGRPLQDSLLDHHAAINPLQRGEFSTDRHQDNKQDQRHQRPALVDSELLGARNIIPL